MTTTSLFNALKAKFIVKKAVVNPKPSVNQVKDSIKKLSSHAGNFKNTVALTAIKYGCTRDEILDIFEKIGKNDEPVKSIKAKTK